MTISDTYTETKELASLRTDAPQGTGSSLSGLDPVPLSKTGTRLLASLGSKGKNRNSLAYLRNAGSYSAQSYCTTSER